jgi:hypothetical protein
MAEQLNFPPHEGVPGNGNPPTIDGYVEIDPPAPTGELPASSGIDLGWTKGSMLTYLGGTYPAVEIRAIRDKSQPYIYLGFIVRGDPFFDDEDVIVLAFQDNYNGAAHATEERRIDIFPMYEDNGAQGPADPALLTYQVRHDQPPHGINYSKWNGTAWASLPDLKFSCRVRSWEVSGEKRWGVEIKIPTNDDTAGGTGNWLNLTSPFGFYANVIRVCGEVACSAGPIPGPGVPIGATLGASQQFTFPRADYATLDRIIQGALVQEIPPAWYGEGLFGAAGSGAGVKFLNHHAGIGVKQGASSTLSYRIEGDLGAPPAPAENKMTARLVNTGPAVTDVHAEFRIANWGLPPASYTNWAKIPARNDTSNPNPNTNPTPAASIPTAANNPPTAADAVDLELWWKLTATERVDYLANSKHQCILVRLSSGQNVTFVEDSVRWNFDFDHLSKLTEVAQISGRGYPPPAGGNNHHFVLHVHRGRLGSGERSSPLVARGERGSVFEWSVHGYRQTPGFVEIQARHAHKKPRTYAILEYVGSFGLHAITKDTSITEIDYDLTGDTLKEVGPGVYQLAVPHNEDIYMRARLAAGERLEPEPWTPPKWTPPKDPGDDGGGRGGGKKPGCGTATATLLTLFGTLGAVLMHWRR